MPPAKSVKRRTRSGCLTCRDRHMKCDEQLPVCQNCIKSQRKCYRGVRLNFIQYSFYNPNLPWDRSMNFHILDQSITIANLYDGRKYYKSYLHLHSPHDLIYSDEIFKLDCENSGPQNNEDNNFELPNSNSNVGTPRLKSSSARNTPKLSSKNSSKPPSKLHSRNISRTISQEPDITKEDLIQGDQLIKSPMVDVDDVMQMNLSISRPATTIDHATFTEELMNTFQISEEHASVPSGGDFNIQNFLLKPKFEIIPENLSSSKVIFDNPNFEFNIESFIRVVENDKFYWILDLFNEFNIWKSMVPSYCMKLVNQENSLISNTFLVNCLLNCCQSNLNDDLSFDNSLDAQLKYYEVIINSELNNENFFSFEVIFISVTLNLLVLLNRLNEFSEEFFNDSMNVQKFILILYNQLRIFDKLIYKLFKLSYSTTMENKSMIFTSCVHSVLILKFMIKKNLQFKNLIPGSVINGMDISITEDDWQENLDETISYSPNPHMHINLDTEMSYFEVKNLDNNFINLEFDQIHNDFNSISNSTSLKLRKVMWAFIKLDYLLLNPNSSLFNIQTMRFDIKFNISIPGKLIVFPNDKLTLLVLLSNHLNKCIQDDTLKLKMETDTTAHDSEQNIKMIYDVVRTSSINQTIKILWDKMFRWLQ